MGLHNILKGAKLITKNNLFSALSFMFFLFCSGEIYAQTSDVENERPKRYESNSLNIFNGEREAVNKADSPELKLLFNQATVFNRQENLLEEEKMLLQAMDYINKNNVSINDAYLTYDLLIEFYEQSSMYDKELPVMEQFVLSRIHFLWEGSAVQQEYFGMLTAVVIHDSWLRNGKLDKIEPFIKQLDEQMQQAKASELALQSDAVSQEKWNKKENYFLGLYESVITSIAYEDDVRAEKMMDDYLSLRTKRGDDLSDFKLTEVMMILADAKFQHNDLIKTEYWLDQIKSMQSRYKTFDYQNNPIVYFDERLWQRYALLHQAQGRYDEAERIWMEFWSRAKAEKKSKSADWSDNYNLKNSLHNLQAFYIQTKAVKKAHAIDVQMRTKALSKTVLSRCAVGNYCLISINSGSH